MAGRNEVEAGAAFVRLFVKDGELRKGLKAAKASLDSFAQAATAIGGGMMAAGAAIGAPIVAAVKSATDFQNVLLDIRAATGLAGSDMDRVQQAALSMSEALGVGPAAAAEGIKELLKAGMDIETVLGGAGEAAIQFARIAEMDVAQAAVIMADMINVFGVEAATAGNVLSSAADASSTSVEDMAQAMAMASAVAGLANQTIDDTSAALALMANAGVKGSDSGTALKTMLLALMAPSETAAKALAEVGLSTDSFRDAEGKMLPLVDVLGIFNQATAGMNQAAKDEAMRKIFGTDAIRAAAILTGAGVDGFTRMRDAMADALPIGEKYRLLMSGLSGRLEKAKAALQRMAVAVEAQVRPALDAAGVGLEAAIGWLTQFIQNNPNFVQGLATAAAGLIATGGALLGLAAAAKTAALGLSIINGTISLMSTIVAIGPIAAGALLGIASAISALYLLDLAGAIDMGRVLESLKETAGYLGGKFLELWASVKDTAVTAWDGITAAIQAGDWKAAGEIAMAGLKSVVAHGIVSLTSMWNDYRQAVLESILGTALIAVETMAKLSKLGGPFAGLLGGALAGKATDIIGGALAESSKNKADSLQEAKDRAKAADDRLKALAETPREFVEDLTEEERARQRGPQPESFVEDIPISEMRPQDAMRLPEVQEGLKLWQGWLGTAARFAKDAATAKLPVVGMSVADSVLGRGGPAGPGEVSRAAPLGIGTQGLVTHSAAALQAMGQMGGGSPQERMAKNIYDMYTELKELGFLTREQTVSNNQVAMMYERFLAAFNYG